MDATDYPREETLVYSDESSLNTIDVYLPSKPVLSTSSRTQDSARVWLLYIHGGAWRDPAISASSFTATRDHLLKSSTGPRIAGVASINYRLSPYPHHPSDPSSPDDPARNARHPDHINDVLSAILYLQEKYDFKDRYVLVGHSCGATLALQVAMRRYWGSQYESTFALELNVEPPMAIICAEGIYDIPALVKEYEDIPVYRDFIANAFGRNETAWKEASPSQADFEESWPDGTMIVLVHSEADELVSEKQPDGMFKALEQQGWKPHEGCLRTVYSVRLERLKHDEVWQDGKDFAKVIADKIDELLNVDAL